MTVHWLSCKVAHSDSQLVQLTAADYAPYAAILVSAGYSTVQYDVNQILAMVPDLEEVQSSSSCFLLISKQCSSLPSALQVNC